MATKKDVFFPSDDDPNAHMDALALARDEGGRIAESFDGPRFVGYTVTFAPVEEQVTDPEVQVEPEESEAPKKAAPRKRAAPKK